MGKIILPKSLKDYLKGEGAYISGGSIFEASLLELLAQYPAIKMESTGSKGQFIILPEEKKALTKGADTIKFIEHTSIIAN